MFKEIFENGKVHILYDDETGEVSFGYYPDKFTTLEHLILAQAFDLTEEEDE